jgi:hypothetical protein
MKVRIRNTILDEKTRAKFQKHISLTRNKNQQFLVMVKDKIILNVGSKVVFPYENKIN